MKISAKLVMELRKKTNAGMMDCKKALVEKEGDLEEAITYLREKGITKAAKKAGRTTSQGLVFGALTNDKKIGALIEFNSETDFVAKNDEFINFGEKLAQIILKNDINNIDELNTFELESGKNIQETLKEMIAKIGENMTIRRLKRVEASGFVNLYIHMGGKIGVLVTTDSELNDENESKVDDIAMHVAAMAPSYFDKTDVTEEDKEHEKSIMKKQLLEQGKPEKIIDKILIGKMRKFYEENCLMQQKFVKDDKISVSQYAGDLNIISADRFKVGEGIEKKEEDFAAEVAAQMNQ